MCFGLDLQVVFSQYSIKEGYNPIGIFIRKYDIEILWPMDSFLLRKKTACKSGLSILTENGYIFEGVMLGFKK
jgi:hypothetical protein